MLAADAKHTSVLDRPLVPATFGPGSQLGPYVIEKALGQGGMGMVYLATRADGAYRKRVAIKILRGDRGGELFLHRFQQERQILAQMDHPHIAAILDAEPILAAQGRVREQVQIEFIHQRGRLQ
jgi:serine/threonine-protein kinase